MLACYASAVHHHTFPITLTEHTSAHGRLSSCRGCHRLSSLPRKSTLTFRSSPASAPLVELDDDDEEATILRQLEQIRLAKAKKQEERRASEEEAAKREKAKRLAALRQQLEAETADLYGSVRMLSSSQTDLGWRRS